MYKRIITPTIGLTILFFATILFLSNKSVTNKIKLEDESGYDPIVVLELFTSQGCSSCPSADMLLDEVKQQYPNTVFVLSYHVDYWNYIGWEDPFSKSVYTKKQRFYNKKFRYGSNYTPQLVVNGKEHFVGSNRSKLTSKISEYGKLKVDNKIIISNAKKVDGLVSFDYKIEGGLKNKQLRAVLVLDERTTSVKRGENRNRVLKNSNIVVAEKFIELENSMGRGAIKIPSLVAEKDKITLLLLTENEVADITGADKKAI